MTSTISEFPSIAETITVTLGPDLAEEHHSYVKSVTDALEEREQDLKNAIAEELRAVATAADLDFTDDQVTQALVSVGLVEPEPVREDEGTPTQASLEAAVAEQGRAIDGLLKSVQRLANLAERHLGASL